MRGNTSLSFDLTAHLKMELVSKMLDVEMWLLRFLNIYKIMLPRDTMVLLVIPK